MAQQLALRVYADHYQFYVHDAEFQGDTSTIWDGAALARHCGVQSGWIAVGTGSYDHVVVEVEVFDSAPLDDLAGWDHAVDVSVALPSGQLVISQCLGPVVAALAVQPGTYRARVYAGGLAGADGTEPSDHYRVAVWPGTVAAPQTVKEYAGWASTPAEEQVQTTPSGLRRYLGARAWDAKNSMRLLASGRLPAEDDEQYRGSLPDDEWQRVKAVLYPMYFLYHDASDGSYWEYTNQPVTSEPVLTELDQTTAKAKYSRSRQYLPWQ